MPKNLANLSISALDEFSHLQKVQDLLAICLDELATPSEGTLLRVELLVALYLPEARLRLEELEITLERIRDLTMGKPKEDT